MGEECSVRGRDKNAYKLLVGKSEETEPLGRSRRKWEDNITPGLRDEDWIQVAQDKDLQQAVVNTTGFHKSRGV